MTDSERITLLEAENRRLEDFANDILEHHTGSLEGCDIEEMAVKYGLLIAVCLLSQGGSPRRCARCEKGAVMHDAEKVRMDGLL